MHSNVDSKKAAVKALLAISRNSKYLHRPRKNICKMSNVAQNLHIKQDLAVVMKTKHDVFRSFLCV